MPDFSNLLGFQDFGEALYAQTQLLDDVQTQFASYDRTQQNVLASLERVVGELRSGPTTDGISVVQNSAAFTVAADYRGNVTAGQLPLDFELTISLLGIDVTDDPRTEVVYSLTGLVGGLTAPGVFTVTALSALVSTATATVSFAGVVQGVWRFQLTVVKADPPPVLNADPDNPTPVEPTLATPAQSFLVNAPRADAYALLGFAGVNGGFVYDFVLNSLLLPVENIAQVSNLEMYAALLSDDAGASWERQGDFAVGTPNEVVYTNVFDRKYTSDKDFIVEPGFIDFTRRIVVPNGVHYIGVFGKLSYGPAVNVQSVAIIEPV